MEEEEEEEAVLEKDMKSISKKILTATQYLDSDNRNEIIKIIC